MCKVIIINKLTLLISDSPSLYGSKCLDPRCTLFTIIQISGKFYVVIHFVIKFLAGNTEVQFAVK